jgi:membrane protein implicated in regulation of membrane protease activity
VVSVVALVWLVAGIVLAAAEALTGDFSLLMLGGGALVTAGFTSVTHFAGWVDALAFAVVSVVLLFGLRPVLLRRMAVRRHLTNIEALPGKTALVLESVGQYQGRVKIDGEVWTARPLDETEVYEVGATVTVMKIDGATAVVWKGP